MHPAHHPTRLTLSRTHTLTHLQQGASNNATAPAAKTVPISFYQDAGAQSDGPIFAVIPGGKGKGAGKGKGFTFNPPSSGKGVGFVIPAMEKPKIKAPKIPAFNGKGKGYVSQGPILEAELPGFTLTKGKGKGSSGPSVKQDGQFSAVVRKPSQQPMYLGAAAPAAAAAKSD